MMKNMRKKKTVKVKEGKKLYKYQDLAREL